MSTPQQTGTLLVRPVSGPKETKAGRVDCAQRSLLSCTFQSSGHHSHVSSGPPRSKSPGHLCKPLGWSSSILNHCLRFKRKQSHPLLAGGLVELDENQCTLTTPPKGLFSLFPPLCYFKSSAQLFSCLTLSHLQGGVKGCTTYPHLPRLHVLHRRSRSLSLSITGY